MRFATRDNGTADGELLLVADDGLYGLPMGSGFPNLLHSMANWDALKQHASTVAVSIARGDGFAIDPASLIAPCPALGSGLMGPPFPTTAR